MLLRHVFVVPFWLPVSVFSMGSMTYFPTGPSFSSVQLFSWKSLYEICHLPFLTTRDFVARPS